MSRFLVFLSVLLALATSSARAQDSDTSQQERSVVSKASPIYPDLAKRTNIIGVVKLRATIGPNGAVKSVEPLGRIRSRLSFGRSLLNRPTLTRPNYIGKDRSIWTSQTGVDLMPQPLHPSWVVPRPFAPRY